MSLIVDTVIDYLGNSELCLGVIVKVMQDRLQVKGANSQLTKISIRQVICEYGHINGASALATLVRIQNEITAASEGIDLDFLLEIMRENPALNTLPAIAAEYFGAEYTPQQLSALGRSLSADPIHFKRNSLTFEPQSPEEIQRLLELRRLRAEKAAWREQVQQWLAKSMHASMEECLEKPLEVPPQLENFISQCQGYLMQGLNCEALNLLAAMPGKQTTRELAVSILKKSGRLPKDADEFLLVNGIHTGFAPSVMKHVQELPPFAGDETRRDLTHLEIFSIDDISTTEIDDALSINTTDDGNYLVGIHLANPSCFVNKEDPLDQTAIDRPLTLYLPTQTVTMFPERLGCDLASLNAGELRPAMSFMVTLDSNGELVDWEILLSQIKVAHRMTYNESDALLAGTTDPQAPDRGPAVLKALQQLDRLAQLRRQFREEVGAITLNRPELRIRVKDDQITVQKESQDTPSHQLVQEFMVLANHLAARYALRNDIPIIYRCQDTPQNGIQSVYHYDPVEFDQQVRKMRRTRLSTYPQQHAGLGLDIYTQISSPLRRYADLVIQRQIGAALSGITPPYTQQELFGIVDNVEKTSATNRSLDKEARKYWLLEYLRRNMMDTTLAITVVRQEGSLVLGELDDYCERGIILTRDRPCLGEKMQVRIVEVNPKVGRLVMEPAN